MHNALVAIHRLKYCNMNISALWIISARQSAIVSQRSFIYIVSYEDNLVPENQCPFDWPKGGYNNECFDFLVFKHLIDNNYVMKDSWIFYEIHLLSRAVKKNDLMNWKRHKLLMQHSPHVKLQLKRVRWCKLRHNAFSCKEFHLNKERVTWIFHEIILLRLSCIHKVVFNFHLKSIKK